jgi:glutathione synthase/RimK-type ligase-like ATP-grasp enzyme
MRGLFWLFGNRSNFVAVSVCISLASIFKDSPSLAISFAGKTGANIPFTSSNKNLLCMKKIGILFGKERTFPQAFVERVNSKKVKGITAEFVEVDEVMVKKPSGYAVIIDRISQDVPFYRAYLKNAAATGTAVINNPFWWSADEKFFNNVLAEQAGVPVPKTVLLPSKEHPDDTTSESFSNLKFPLEWEEMLEYLGGFPAFMKPHDGGGWKSVYKVNNWAEVFNAHNETGQLVMMLQKAVEFDSYFRCYCIGRKYVRIMNYEPRNPQHLRYVVGHHPSRELLATMEDYVLRLCNALGYDFNTVEFGVQDGVPYAIDFCNPAPDADVNSVGQENFEWVVETSANYAIEQALAHKEGQLNLTWGTFIKNAAQGLLPDAGSPAKPAAKKAVSKRKKAK